MTRYGPIRTRTRRAGTVVLLLVAYLFVSPLPGRAETAGTWKEVSVGYGHTCAIASDDSAWCWGLNNYGQLGDGSSDVRTVPAQVASGGMYPSAWKAISAGFLHTCAIASDDSMWCWGYGLEGNLGNGLGAASDVPVQTSAASWTAVTVGAYISCGISSGAVSCWGDDEWGALGNGTPYADSLVPVAIRVDGGRPATYSSISGQGRTVCGVSSDGASTGTVWCWGDVDHDAWPVAAPVERGLEAAAAEVSSGESHTCALTSGGAARCWGFNADGSLGTGSSPGSIYLPALVQTGTSLGAPELLPDTYSAIAADGSHTCAISASGGTMSAPVGTVWCWGNGSYGELGYGAFTDSPTPALVVWGGTLPSTYSSVSSGTFSTCAIASDGDFAGTLWCWGSAAIGTLGDGVSGSSATPVQVVGGVSGPTCDTGSPTSACHEVSYEIISARSISLESTDTVDFGRVRQGHAAEEFGPDIYYATTWTGDAITVELSEDSQFGISLLFDVLTISPPSGTVQCEGEGTDSTDPDPVTLTTSPIPVITNIDSCGDPGASDSVDGATATTLFTVDATEANDIETDYTYPVSTTVTYTIDAGA